jgi:hypothetical protein
VLDNAIKTESTVPAPAKTEVPAPAAPGDSRAKDVPR